MGDSKAGLPLDLKYVQLLCETGWSPDVLDATPLDIVQKYVIYQNVKAVCLYGGEYRP